MTTDFLLKSQNTLPIPEDWKKYMSDLINNGNYLDTSFVNGLRRYSISKINSVAFEYSPTPMVKDYIIFEKNTSNMNNDFIGHRIGLVPVNIVGIKYIALIYKILIGHHSELDEILKLLEDKVSNYDNCVKKLKSNLKLQKNIDLISRIEFYINEVNDKDDIMNITTENILFKLEHEITMSDISRFIPLFELYEKYNDISESFAKNISIENLLKYVFNYIYKSEDETKNGILLCKLKQNEKLNCKMYLNIGNGEKHARWSVVAPCTYSFELNNPLILKILDERCKKLTITPEKLKLSLGDYYNKIESFINTRYTDLSVFKLEPKNVEEKNILYNSEDFKELDEDMKKIIKQYISDKDTLLNTFNKCDYQRYYKGKEEYELFYREFKMEIESVGFYTPERILNKTFKLLKNELLEECNRVSYLLSNYNSFPIQNEKIVISDSDKIENGVDILFVISNHSIGNILSSYIYHLNFKEISYIAYKMVHPLKKEMLITIGLKNIEDKSQQIISIFKNLITSFENMDYSKL